MALIYGSIVRQTETEILLSVNTTRGDARHFGLCGEVWFRKVQFVELPPEDGFDRIKVPAQVAIAKAAACQSCE